MFVESLVLIGDGDDGAFSEGEAVKGDCGAVDGSSLFLALFTSNSEEDDKEIIPPPGESPSSILDRSDD